MKKVISELIEQNRKSFYDKFYPGETTELRSSEEVEYQEKNDSEMIDKIIKIVKNDSN